MERKLRLKPIRYHDRKHRKARWVYLCECGKEVICYRHNIRSGATLSCGCYQLDVVTKTNHNHVPLNGMLVRQNRIRLGLTRHQLAKLAKVPVWFIANHEQGKAAHTAIENVTNLAKVFNISTEELTNVDGIL